MIKRIVKRKKLKNKKDIGYVYIKQNKNKTYTVYLYVMGLGRFILGKDKRRKYHTLDEAIKIYNDKQVL